MSDNNTTKVGLPVILSERKAGANYMCSLKKYTGASVDKKQKNKNITNVI